MIEFESYKHNLVVTDVHGLQNVSMSKSIICSGSHKTFEKKSYDDKESDPPLAATVIGLNNTSASNTQKPKPTNIWTDIDSQEHYINSKPTCYLIISKPGVGGFSLGEAMSKKFKCVHVCPKNIILDEIEQESPTGKCMHYNMIQNNVLKYDIILSLMKRKLESPAVKHRGYVISGFPLITTNTKSEYFTNTLFSEEALNTVDEILFDTIANLKKKKKKLKSQTGSPHTSISSDVGPLEEEVEIEAEEEHVEEEAEEPPVALPRFLLDPCENIIFHQKVTIITLKLMLLEQCKELFNTSLTPDIIIHLTCPDQDVAIKRNHKYFNYKTSSHTYYHFIPHTEFDLRWPLKYNMSDNPSSHEIHNFNPKYNCRQPVNFTENSINQLCNYKHHVFSFVEEKLKDYDPKFIFKLDARNSVHQMMHQINERSILLAIQHVHIPEPLYLEDPPDDLGDFWKLIEETNVIKSGVLRFNRIPSFWLNRCPVELKKRRSVVGKPKFAVMFLKHVYLLSSLNALISFCRNPRPYLQLKYLEPTCRVIIIGTKSSGKTMIANCLSFIFDTPILTYDKFVEDEKQKKYTTFAKSILSEIIATIEDARHTKWLVLETERKFKLNEWAVNISNLLNQYISVYEQIHRSETREFFAEMEEEENDPDPELLEKYNELRVLLACLPFLDDINECFNAIHDKNLMAFAPESLVTETDKPSTPLLGDEDVTVAISNYIINNELEKEIEPTVEELMVEIVNFLDEKTQHSTDKYINFIIDGFPSDPEYWNYLSDSNLLPDHTIALIENREIDEELIQYYSNFTKSIKNYQDSFSVVNDPLMKVKLLNSQLPDSKNIDVQIILNDFFTSLYASIFAQSDESEEKTVNDESEWVSSFSASIEKFREDWDSLKLKLEEDQRSFIEVELENKSDIRVIDEVLLNLRKSYFLTCEPNEDEEIESPGEEDEIPKDILSYNSSRRFCDTNVYCPIAYYDYWVLWEGKSEFSLKYDDKVHYFCKEECYEKFQTDVTHYQGYNNPHKSLPPIRICVIGCIGSGKSTISKLIAKEIGLIHVDFLEFMNNCLLPKHVKKVGRHYENSFIDEPIDEEGVSEFNVDEENENLLSDLLGNTGELRKIIFNYYERGTPVFPVLMQKVIKKLWFEEPFRSTGFVLDGYPRLPSDVEDMVTCFCIPDLIIELESSSEASIERVSVNMFKVWKTQLYEAKNAAKKKMNEERNIWMNFITKNVVSKLIVEEVIDKIFLVNEPTNILSEASVIIEPNPMGSMNVDVNLFNFYNEMIQEYPGPVDTSEWEKPDEARERIDSRIEAIYETDDEGIQELKDILLEQKIKLISVNSAKALNKVFRVALFKLTSLRNRVQSFFEQSFVINCDIAETLLMEGFYFLSKFQRLCPVYIKENAKSIINPYKIMKRDGKVFPVIHRAFIYFIFGEENLKKFRINPLEFLSYNNCLNSFIEYPLTIAVVGPPKSGKSTLAKKLAKRYGLICISRGMAIRYILEKMHWTKLASLMKTSLDNGECINCEQIMNSVRCALIDHRTITYGIVFDGFPETASEAMELIEAGVYPMVLFDISSDKEKILQHSQSEVYYDILKYKPPYPLPLIDLRFACWFEKRYQVRDWVQQDPQNLYLLDGNGSKWRCAQQAVDCINEIGPKIHYYLNNVIKNIVPASFMCITNKAFEDRISDFKEFCPICVKNKVLRHGGFPLNKKGVVQFQNRFYWFCDEHMQLALNNPKRYLSIKPTSIPEIPAIVKNVNVSLIYENGICIVTYAQNLPAQKIVRGDPKYAATYKGRTYLFCSSKCLNSFLEKPQIYNDIVVFKGVKFPELNLNKLPTIGYLEQMLGNLITRACCFVNVIRPKYPGLSIQLSGLLYVALYLKTHNPKIDKFILPFYIKAAQVYDARCKLMIDIGLRLRSMDNPFVDYPKCCTQEKNPDSGTVDKKHSSLVSVSSSRTAKSSKHF